MLFALHFILSYLAVALSCLDHPTHMTKTALIVVDVQNDFCKGGSLEVPDGDAVVPVINSLREHLVYDGVALDLPSLMSRPSAVIGKLSDALNRLSPVTSLVCLTQDWHPPGHTSFQSTHASEGAKLFQSFKLEDGTEQMMWPDHCFNDGLIIKSTDKIIKKGTDPKVDQLVDSYSGFYDNNRKHHTDLDAILEAAQIGRVIAVGLAFDYCVGFTALDAVGLGYDVIVVEDATRPVASDSAAAMRTRLEKAGVKLMTAEEVESAAAKWSIR